MSKRKNPTAEEIAEMADRGEDVTVYMSTPTKIGVHRTTLDLGVDLMHDIDYICGTLNVSRQALIKIAMQDYVMRWKHSQLVKLG